MLKCTAALPVLLVFLPSARGIKGMPSREAVDRPEVVLINALAPAAQKAGSSTGVLIAPTVVLTAAHCVHGFDIFEVIAPYAKNHNLKPVISKVAHAHPRFQPGDIDDDLGVIILKEPLQIGAALPTLHDGDLLPLETKLIVVGRVKRGTPSPSQLYEAGVTLVAFPSNINIYGGFPQTVEKGDSGGPLFLPGKEHKIVGIVSGLLEFSRANVPTDAYVPISKNNREWILQYVTK